MRHGAAHLPLPARPQGLHLSRLLKELFRIYCRLLAFARLTRLLLAGRLLWLGNARLSKLLRLLSLKLLEDAVQVVLLTFELLECKNKLATETTANVLQPTDINKASQHGHVRLKN